MYKSNNITIVLLILCGFVGTTSTTRIEVIETANQIENPISFSRASTAYVVDGPLTNQETLKVLRGRADTEPIVIEVADAIEAVTALSNNQLAYVIRGGGFPSILKIANIRKNIIYTIDHQFINILETIALSKGSLAYAAYFGSTKKLKRVDWDPLIQQPVATVIESIHFDGQFSQILALPKGALAYVVKNHNENLETLKIALRDSNIMPIFIDTAVTFDQLMVNSKGIMTYLAFDGSQWVLKKLLFR